MKIGFVSLGCPKNLVDSEVMMGQLVARGHELTSHPDQAEVLVVNTCSFIDPAKKESVDTILEMARVQKGGPRPQVDRRRLPGGALSRRHPPGNARGGRARRHQRTRQHRGAVRRHGTGRRRRGAVSLPRSHPARTGHSRAISPTSRLPKAATIPAPSVSSRNTAENSAAAASNR